jgi:hypothetical protein
MSNDEYMYVDADTGQPVNVPNQDGKQNYIPSGSIQKQDKADILDKIRPDIIIEVMRHKLMGEEYNQDTKKWIPNPAFKDYSLTKVGAEQIANLMLGVSSQNVSISNLKDREIKERVLSIAKTAQYMALENWVEYGIKRKSQFYFIHEIVFSNSLVVLKQPEGEGIRRLIAGTIQENRTYSSNEEKEKKLLGMFRRRG